MHPTIVDVVYLALAVATPIAFELLVTTRRLKANVAARVRGARLRSYRRTIAIQLALSLPVVIGWLLSGRSWTALWLVPRLVGWRALASATMIVAVTGLGLMQVRGIRRIAADDEKRQRYRKGMAGAAFMLPQTDHEYRWFAALSVTGGVCEEFLFRGYMMWVLLAYMNLPVAVSVSAAIFGVGHLYQGARVALRTAAIGVLMNLMVLAGGWLLPAMYVHALLNATTGRLAYIAFQNTQNV